MSFAPQQTNMGGVVQPQVTTNAQVNGDPMSFGGPNIGGPGRQAGNSYSGAITTGSFYQ